MRLKLPPIPKPETVKRGPRLYEFGKDHGHTGGPGDPPPGFVTIKTTATEWPIYWALAKVLGTPAADNRLLVSVLSLAMLSAIALVPSVSAVQIRRCLAP